ncbi:MAG: hypothetical protein Q8K63_00465 [Acidimicrobiales bacterium]|nr:hypothetical protein [Acidimicrobiales bacterium]
MRFARLASDALLDELLHGSASSLITRRLADGGKTLDIQLRRSATWPEESAMTWASLYCGLSAVLDVAERNGKFKIRSHPTYKRASTGLFDGAWSKWMTKAELQSAWPKVEQFLEWVLSDANTALQRYKAQEGKVHSIMCAGLSPEYRVIQREAIVAFSDNPLLKKTMSDHNEAITTVFNANQRPNVPWWIGVRDNKVIPKFGNELDLLAVDAAGRLLLIEVKPPLATKGITAAPAQVHVYTRLFRSLIDAQEDFVPVLNQMLAQRTSLGLTAAGPELPTHPQLVPVVAIGHGLRSRVVLDRLAQVQAVLPKFNDPRIDPVEVWLMNDQGERVARWFPDTEVVPKWV